VIELVTATRFVTPLREGGSLPGLVEASDFGTYVVKFRGAGQGLKVLVAEVVVGELARRLGLRVPELKMVQLGADIARYEADEEVQDLLNASLGFNLGVDFLPGALGWHPKAEVPREQAAAVLWLDAFTANVDRSWRNPNLLLWHRELVLIDHGAALYFHHSWDSPTATPNRFAAQPYDFSDHVFATAAADLAAVDADYAARVDAQLLAEVVDQVPPEWLETSEQRPRPEDVRRAYVEFLTARLAQRESWLPGARR